MGELKVTSSIVLSEQCCNDLIDLYQRNSFLAGEWQGTNPLSLVYLQNNDYFFVKHIVKNLSEIASSVCGIKLFFEVAEIVKWPEGSLKGFHKDSNRNSTVFTSVTYLNSDYIGGCTVFEGDIKINPDIGKTIFFDGRNINHSVEKIFTGNRYTLAVWYSISTN